MGCADIIGRGPVTVVVNCVTADGVLDEDDVETIAAGTRAETARPCDINDSQPMDEVRACAEGKLRDFARAYRRVMNIVEGRTPGIRAAENVGASVRANVEFNTLRRANSEVSAREFDEALVKLVQNVVVVGSTLAFLLGVLLIL